jgi:carboxyl-terminal processing protease
LAAAEELWRQQLRAEFLEEKLAAKPPRDIAAALIRRHQQHLKTLTALGEDDVLELYLDALAHVYDPHSDYLSRQSMESLSITTNLSLVGKGTVWTTTPLASVMDQAGLSHAFDPGALKVTISKFYRPSGASTQLRGVESDIVIPATSGVLPVGESQLNDPLPWDTVSATGFRPYGQLAPYLGALRVASELRVATDPAFVELRPEIARLKTRFDDNSVSLNEAERRRERADQKAFQKAIAPEVQDREAGLPVYEITVRAAGQPGLPEQLTGLAKPAKTGAAPKAGADADETASARAADALVLYEALHIMADLVDLLSGPPRSGG